MLHDKDQVRAKPTRHKGGWNPTSTGGQPYHQEQRNQEEAEAEESQTNPKRRITKTYPHTTKEKQNGVENKRSSFDVHHHTTKIQQNGVEAQASTTIHFSQIRCTINKQKLKGEESYSTDLKCWALAEGNR